MEEFASRLVSKETEFRQLFNSLPPEIKNEVLNKPPIRSYYTTTKQNYYCYSDISKEEFIAYILDNNVEKFGIYWYDDHEDYNAAICTKNIGDDYEVRQINTHIDVIELDEYKPYVDQYEYDNEITAIVQSIFDDITNKNFAYDLESVSNILKIRNCTNINYYLHDYLDKQTIIKKYSDLNYTKTLLYANIYINTNNVLLLGEAYQEYPLEGVFDHEGEIVEDYVDDLDWLKADYIDDFRNSLHNYIFNI